MLALALALSTGLPAAVEATGLQPQLRLIREQAAKLGWPITCVGHAGDEGVIRIGVPNGTSSNAVENFEADLIGIASSVTDVPPDADQEHCDRKPTRTESSGPPSRTLIFWPGAEFNTDDKASRLLAVAHDCGFPNAHWRPIRPEDVEQFSGKIDPNKDSMVLDAGRDTRTLYGPIICFLNLGVRPLIRKDQG